MMAGMTAFPYPQLTGLAALEAAARERTLPAHISRLLAAAETVAMAPEQAAVLRTLAAALQLDLALLHKHPDDLFAALFRRCALYDSVEGARLGAPGPRAATRGGVSVLAQQWLGDYAQRGLPWVQTMLPPEYLPGSPLLAELLLPEDQDLLGIGEDGDVYFADTWRTAARLRTHWCVRTGELSATSHPFVQPRVPGALRVVFKAWTSATLHDDGQGTAHPLPIPAGGDPALCTFSADGTLVAVAGSEDEYAAGFVHVYEIATTRLVHAFSAESRFGSMLAFTPDGQQLLAANADGVYLWELTAATPAAPEFYALGENAQACLSADGTRLAVKGLGRTVRLFDLAALRAHNKRPPRPPHLLLFSPDGSRLLNGPWLCDGYTGRRQRRLNFPCPKYPENGPPANYLHFGSDRIIYLVQDVRVWDTATGKSIRNWHNGPHERYATGDLVSFARDGRSYAVSCDEKPPLRIIDADTGAARVTLAIEGVTALALSVDGRLLASGTERGEVTVWDAHTGTRLVLLPVHAKPIAELCFSLDGRLLATAAYDEKLRVSQVADGATVATRPLDAKDPTYQRPSWQKINPHKRRRTWCATADELRKLEAWVGFTTAPAPRYRAAVADGATCIVDTQTGELLARFPEITRWVAHPEAAIFAGPYAHLQLRTPP